MSEINKQIEILKDSIKSEDEKLGLSIALDLLCGLLIDVERISVSLVQIANSLRRIEDK